MVHLIPEIPGSRTGRSRFGDVAEERIDLVLIGADDDVGHQPAEVVLHSEATDGKHLGDIRIGLVLDCDHIHVVLTVISHGAAVGLDVHDV